jgi:hypothetical protein
LALVYFSAHETIEQIQSGSNEGELPAEIGKNGKKQNPQKGDAGCPGGFCIPTMTQDMPATP